MPKFEEAAKMESSDNPRILYSVIESIMEAAGELYAQACRTERIMFGMPETKACEVTPPSTIEEKLLYIEDMLRQAYKKALNNNIRIEG